MNTLRCSFILLACCFCAMLCAQSPDSVAVKPSIDSSKLVTTDTSKGFMKHWSKPKKALIYSLVLPGAGQVYNKKWWKLPIVAGGFYAGYRAIDFNRKEYIFYRDVLISRLQYDFDPLGRPDVSNALVRQVRDGYNRQLQTSVLLTGVFYLLVAVDAFVDAHLSTFDVSDNLSFKPYASPQAPIGLSFQYALGK